ncbi:MAG: rod shape-determining protein RodA [Bacteroidales bacterium OttesenSCG-928-I14]|jgi:rod shape determining protein RodA|nr:rod shape-determining protein RodA [Bacteroidales bacterium OttesenSCG-928-I14]
MLLKKTNLFRIFDWNIITVYLLLVLIGWFCVYSTSYCPNVNVNSFFFHTRPGLQIIWIFISLCIAFLLLSIDRNWYETFAFVIYIVTIILLIVTIFFAKPIKGSYSWLTFGGVKIQPVEFAKFSTALVISKLISKYQFSMSEKQNIFNVSIFVFLPALLVVLQKELGSALVFFSFFLVFYREGMSTRIVFVTIFIIFLSFLIIRYPYVVTSNISLGKLLGMLSIILFIIFFSSIHNHKKKLKHLKYLFCFIYVILPVAIFLILFTSYNVKWIIFFLFLFIFFYLLIFFIKVRVSIYLFSISFLCGSLSFLYFTDCIFEKLLKPYQKNRIQVALGMLNDPTGAGYNVKQSMIAIGSGGFFGKGYMKGTQTQLKYVPEQETDFIFCTVGEEIGFIGSVLVLILFIILITRIINLAEKQKFDFARIYGYAVASIIFFHFVVNIGMAIGILPIVGIPLPFFSYGGSSMLSFTILLFVFLGLDTSKSVIKFTRK